MDQEETSSPTLPHSTSSKAIFWLLGSLFNLKIYCFKFWWSIKPHGPLLACELHHWYFSYDLLTQRAFFFSCELGQQVCYGLTPNNLGGSQAYIILRKQHQPLGHSSSYQRLMKKSFYKIRSHYQKDMIGWEIMFRSLWGIDDHQACPFYLRIPCLCIF